MSATLCLNGAAVLLKISADALARKARAGLVPGAKVGRRWVFIEADLLELIREQTRARAQFGGRISAALTNSRAGAGVGAEARAAMARLDAEIVKLAGKPPRVASGARQAANGGAAAASPGNAIPQGRAQPPTTKAPGRS